MKWYCTIPLLLVLLAISAGCRRSEEVDEIAASTFAADSVPAQHISLAELAADPAVYLDQPIQLTGQFQPLPKLVCPANNARKSPAAWSLTGEGWVAQVGGMYEDIADLAPPGLTMTVEGTWRLWSGPVGCGKQAVISDSWYLEISEIMAPKPLTRVTLTPSGAVVAATAPPPALTGTEIAQAPSPTSEVEPADDSSTPSPGAATSTPTPVPLATLLPSATIALTATTIPVTSTVLPDPGQGETETPTPESTPSETPPTTPSASPSSTPGTETPTATASATPSGPQIVDMDHVEFHSLVLDTLSPGTRHAYTFTVEAGTAITIGLLMPSGFDPVIKLLDDGGNTILDQNVAGAGEVERVEHKVLENDGEYRIIVHDVEDRGTDYTFTMNDGQSLDHLYFAGLLSYDGADNTLMPANQIDFWHFWGEAGDEVTISLEPNDTISDMRFLLLSPLFEDLSGGFIDLRPGGQPEQATFVLPLTGIYTIQVEEYNLLSADYLIRLTEN